LELQTSTLQELGHQRWSVVVKPYNDKHINETTKIRTFESTVDSSELVWHQDHNTRNVTVLEGHGWALQLDNQLPTQMLPGITYTIPAKIFHRVLKGVDNLVVEITESI
jgi:quercetin dioxygenase-like cupin family protein